MDMLSDTGKMIEETAQRIFSSHCTSEALRASEGGWHEALWSDLAEAGLPLALEPAEGGELGVSVADALNIVRLAGRFSAPVPLAEAMLANWLLRRSGAEADERPLSLAGLHRRDTLKLEQTTDGWRLTGVSHRTPWARFCTLLAVVEDGGTIRIALTPAGAATVTPGENLAREARDDVSFDIALPASAVHACDLSLDDVRAQGAAIRVLQMAGALDGVLDLTVRYAQDRVQFGRPIAKFQAVQQNIAIMGGQVAAARAAAIAMAEAFGRPDALFAIASAKIRAGEAAGIATRYSHQVHGAIGVTQDYDLHFLTKRLWSWRDEFGAEPYWSKRLGEEVCRRGPDQAWGFITAGLRTRPAQD